MGKHDDHHKKPHHHHRHHGDPHDHHHHHRGASLSFVAKDDIDAILAPLVPDARERALVVRCVLDEGPAHHRGANYVLIKLLATLTDDELTPTRDGLPVPMRLPPHVKGDSDALYPLRMPTAPLQAIAADERDVEEMADCLLDGPPQHALANVIMVCLLDALLKQRRLDRPAPAERE